MTWSPKFSFKCCPAPREVRAVLQHAWGPTQIHQPSENAVDLLIREICMWTKRIVYELHSLWTIYLRNKSEKP